MLPNQFSATEGSFPCLFCLKEGSASMKYTKTGKPTLFCGNCGTRVFINSEAAFKGLRLLTGCMDLLCAASMQGASGILKKVLTVGG
jgi:transcription elongation factor Elf1